MPTAKKPVPGKSKPQGKGGKPSPASRKPGTGLNKKVGGLPIWGWGALVIGAIAVGLYFRSRGSGGGGNVAQPETSGQDVGGAGSVGGGGLSEGDQIGQLASAIEDLQNQLGAGVAFLGPPDKVPADGGGNDGGTPGGTDPGQPPNYGSVGGTLKTAVYSPAGAARSDLRNQLKKVAAPKPHKAVKAKHPKSKPQAAVKHTAHPASSHPQHAAVAHKVAAKPAAKKGKK